jgi:hypothetical protein
MVGGGDDDDSMYYKIGARVVYSNTNNLLLPLAATVVQDASRTLMHETEGTTGTGAADGCAPGGVIRMDISRSSTSSECSPRFDALYSTAENLPWIMISTILYYVEHSAMIRMEYDSSMRGDHIELAGAAGVQSMKPRG